MERTLPELRDRLRRPVKASASRSGVHLSSAAVPVAVGDLRPVDGLLVLRWRLGWMTIQSAYGCSGSGPRGRTKTTSDRAGPTPRGVDAAGLDPAPCHRTRPYPSGEFPEPDTTDPSWRRRPAGAGVVAPTWPSRRRAARTDPTAFDSIRPPNGGRRTYASPPRRDGTSWRSQAHTPAAGPHDGLVALRRGQVWHYSPCSWRSR